ncbi:MAG: WhiB family transcriptional regulator [Cryobacterium sp.]|nr:WhiB family transcriptional regulator [Cryobacterium sp.]
MRLLPCSEDPDLFFRDTAKSNRRAKELCDECPLKARQACLTQAIEDDERHGIWGGLTYDERKALTGTLPSGWRTEVPPACSICESTTLKVTSTNSGGRWPTHTATCQQCSMSWPITAALARAIAAKGVQSSYV